MLALLLLFATLGPGAGIGDLNAQPAFQLTPENLNGGWLGRSIAYYADENNRLSIDQIRRGQVEFTALDADSGHFGFGNPASYWFRLTVNNPGRIDQDWVLDVDYVFLDQVVLYRPALNQPGAYERIATGDQLPFVDREIEHRTFAFHVRTPPGSHVYYLKLYNPAQARFPVRAWSQSAFTSYRLLDWMSTAAIFGGLIILFLSNLLLFAAVRNVAYLYLLVFIPATALLYLLISGFGFQYFWPELPVLNQSIITVVPMMALGFVGYLRHLLDTRILVPRLDFILRILLGICLSFALLNLLVPYAFLASIAALAAIPILGMLILVIFVIGFAAIGADEPAGRFYLVGVLLFALAVSVAVLSLLDIAPASATLSFLARVCSLILTAWMTVGVHYKIKLLRDNLQNLNARKRNLANESNQHPQPATETPESLPSSGAQRGGPKKQSQISENQANDPELESNPGNWTIGPRMEQKLQQALFYLKENFRSDISREGLAARLEVNPDNLGRFFLMYTGDKLGDYTNKLRIEAAARRLNDRGDIRISEVAGEVGFENVSTFNRIFKKIMGRTPTDYRAQLEQNR